MSQKFKVFASLLVLPVLIAGCATEPVKKATKEEASQEIHLKEDRKKLEEIRKEVPEETREFNDETALILNLFNDTNRTPSEVQSKFYTMTNKKRDEYSKAERRRREDYSTDERKRRDKFSEQARRSRESSKIGKMTKEDRSSFFTEQDTERRRFYADEMDARRSFESKLREERQEFDSHMRDMRSRFDSEYRNYLKTYSERKKLEGDKQKMQAIQPTKRQNFSNETPPPGFTEDDMKDLDSIPKSGKSLTPSDSE